MKIPILGTPARGLALTLLIAPLAALPAQSTQPVTIRFQATVAGRPFTCGETYADIGTTRDRITVSDFRFYVHDVRLLDADGRETPVQLETDSLWQSNGVALLDFENGTGPCSNGNADRRDVVVGTAPAGRYSGLRFAIGVPFALNHRDLTLQPSPLSLSRMFWAWNSGYKFMRIDMKNAGAQGWVLHLGSTECQPTGSPTAIPTTCAWGNRPEITFAAFDAEHDAVRLDLASLLRDSNVSVNQPKTAMGCMSGQGDGDCAGVFAALGLPFRSAKGGTQWAFTAVRGVASAGAPPASAR